MNRNAFSIRKDFEQFAESDDTLRVYRQGRLLFSSKRDRVVPLLEYIDSGEPANGPAIIFDKVMGNAAALLSVKARASEVYSPLGSQLGAQTLVKHGIRFHFKKTIPFILKDDSQDMCFMEKLSMDKGPEDFYSAIKAIIK